MRNKIIIIFIMAISFLFSQCHNNAESQKNQSFLDEYVKYTNFQSWHSFLNDSFPDINIKDLEFNFKRSISLDGYKLPSENIQELSKRSFTLNYHNNIYAIDVYWDVSFNYSLNNDSILVGGRDVDPAMAIYNFKDSLLYSYTGGPTTFFDESIWLSDTTFVIFGISFWPGQDSYQQLIVIKAQLKNAIIKIDYYLSETMPWKNSWEDYMVYKYPDIIIDY